MFCYMESSHAHLGMGVWFAARNFNAATNKILFSPRVCIFLWIAMQTLALLPPRLLIKGLIKLSRKSKEFRSSSSQPELDIYNKPDELVPLLLEADRQQVSCAFCLNWFGGNF